jgi:peptidoglycan/LPS O-acetylase OafA/YrhL
MKSTRDIRALTGIRGVAACYVMLYHFCQNAHGLPFQAVLTHGYISVDLFFVLSGFVMALNYSGEFHEFRWRAYKAYLEKRFARVYPLFFMMTIAVILVRAVFGAGMPISPAMVVANLLGINAWGATDTIDGPAWSISTEFAAYILFPVLVAWTLRNSRTGGIVTGAIAFCVLGALVLVPDTITQLNIATGLDKGIRHGPLDVHTTRPPLGLVRCLAGFTIGILSFRLWRSDLGKRLATSKHASDIVAGAAIALLFFSGSDLFEVALFALLIVALAEGKGYTARFLSSGPVHWLGLISYSIYLVHYPVLDSLGAWFAAQLDNAHIAHSYTLSGIASAPISLALATLTYYGVEKPGRILFLKIAHRKAPPMEAVPAAP